MELETMTDAEAGQPLPASPDLSAVPDAELDAALSGFDVVAEPEPTVVGADDPPEKEPEVKTEAPAEATEEPTPEAVAATEKPEEKPMTEIDEIRSLIEISNLKSQQATSENERNRLLADRRAGEIAHLKQVLQSRERGGATDPGNDEFRETDADEPGARRAVPQEFQSELAEIRTERVRRSLEMEGHAFKDRNREFFDTLGKQDPDTQAAFMTDFNATLKQKADEFHDALTGSDAKLAAVSGRTAYDSAMTEARIRLEQRRIDDSRKRREAAQASLIEQKRASAPTQGEAARQPAAAVADKPLHELSDKELNARLRSIRFGA